jgi:hypothetical protein
MKKKINMMSEIAEKYGLELDKTFNLFNSEITELNDYKNKEYKFTEKGLRDQYGGGGYGETLTCILRGEYFVEKVPEFAEPVECGFNEHYLYILVSGKVAKGYYTGDTGDRAMWMIGNMFDIDAIIPEQQIKKMVEKLKGGIL